MRAWEILNESADTQPMYHGTSSEEAALKIMHDGLLIGRETQERYHLAPVKGRVYMTRDISYAAIYAIGGSMLGHDLPQSMLKSRYGYVFVIRDGDLGTIHPDEDSVGQFLSQNSMRNPQRRWEFISKPDLEWEKKTVFDYIYRNMTENQRRGACEGMIAAQAQGGKRALKGMPDWMKTRLIEWGAHVAHDGPVRPSECWRIDKTRCRELAKDGSNFFEIAERVPLPNRLDEVDLGGSLEPQYIDDMDELDFNNPQMDLFPEHPSVEPGLPPGFQKVGQIGQYSILQDRRGGTPNFDDSIIVYVLIDRNKPIAFLELKTETKGWLRRSISDVLEGVGMQASAIYVAPEYRNQRIAASLYRWVLENVCDYIMADEIHTRQGAQLWKSFLNSRKFVVEVFDGNGCLTRKRWVGKDFNRVYARDDLLPWMTIPQKHNMVLFGERE